MFYGIWMVPPIMAYIGRLSPEGVSFLGLRYIKGWGYWFHKLRFMKRERKLLFNYFKGPLITCKYHILSRCTLWLYHLIFLGKTWQGNFLFWQFIQNMGQLWKYVKYVFIFFCEDVVWKGKVLDLRAEPHPIELHRVPLVTACWSSTEKVIIECLHMHAVSR